jgi:hypothetical protein
MTDEQRKRGGTILEALITTLREGAANTPTGMMTTINAHVHEVTSKTLARLGMGYERADVLEVWLMFQLSAGMAKQGERGEPVPPAAGDA